VRLFHSLQHAGLTRRSLIYALTSQVILVRRDFTGFPTFRS
jgi:hypothetical protein